MVNTSIKIIRFLEEKVKFKLSVLYLLSQGTSKKHKIKTKKEKCFFVNLKNANTVKITYFLLHLRWWVFLKIL